MTEPRNDETILKETAAEETVCAEETVTADAQQPAPEAESPPEAGISEAEQLEELTEKHLRLAAEYDNFRKRTAREREQLTEFVVADTVARFLPMMDSLHLAHANRGGNAEDVQAGLDKILQSMEDTIAALGLVEIDTSGEFDPNLHNAILHVDDASLPPNSIVQVFQRGYLYRERVVRHAMVSVAN